VPRLSDYEYTYVPRKRRPLTAEHPGLVTIGPRIKLSRERLGLSRAALAQRLGVPAKRIGQLERGEDRPSYEAALKLARALDVKSGWLITGEP
jgi:putative transcriptional regulator